MPFIPLDENSIQTLTAGTSGARKAGVKGLKYISSIKQWHCYIPVKEGRWEEEETAVEGS